MNNKIPTFSGHVGKPCVWSSRGVLNCYLKVRYTYKHFKWNSEIHSNSNPYFAYGTHSNTYSFEEKKLLYNEPSC